MSDVENSPELKAESHSDQGGPSSHHEKSQSTEASHQDLQCLPSPGVSSLADVSPSPSDEFTGLLSLPWEVLSQIASHLPADFVVNVLPNVCHALGNVVKDRTAWQLRAQRLLGSQARYPVGPRDDFDWVTACLELEQLLTCWIGDDHHVARRIQRLEDEEGVARPDEEPVAEGEEDGGDVERVGVAAQEDDFGEDEAIEVGIEDENIQVPEDQLERLRQEFEEGLMRNAQRNNIRIDGPQLGDHNYHLNDLAEPGNERQEPNSLSPSTELECITLPSDHISYINSVLLLGGEGKLCATASRDWNVKLWDLQAGSNGALLHTLRKPGDFNSHKGWVWCLASQGPLLASGSFDSTVRLWDLQASGAERGLIRTGTAVLCLSCQTDMLLAGTFDKRVSMYDTRAAVPLIKSVRLHGNAVMCLAADDKYVISGSKDSTVVVYDRRAGKSLKKIQVRSYLLSMSYSGCEIWAGDNSGKLHSFSLQAGTLKPLSQFDVGHTAVVTGIHRSPGSLYSCSSDGTVKVHIPCGPPRTLSTLHHRAAVHGLSVEAGVLAVASGDMFGCVEVWRHRN
ncbi:F-box/WD repeat-containing protein 9 [Pholidichthys leucotaenia]